MVVEEAEAVEAEAVAEAIVAEEAAEAAEDEHRRGSDGGRRREGVSPRARPGPIPTHDPPVPGGSFRFLHQERTVADASRRRIR